MRDETALFSQPGSVNADVVLRQEILEILDRRDAAAAVIVHPARELSVAISCSICAMPKNENAATTRMHILGYRISRAG